MNSFSVWYLFLNHSSFLYKQVQLIDEHDDIIFVNQYMQSHESNEEILLKNLKAFICDRINDWLFKYKKVNKKKIKDLRSWYNSEMKKREKINKKWEKS